MPLIDVATARRELRLGSEVQDADIVRKLETAEEQASMFLGRNVYGAQEDLDAAVAQAQDAFTAAAAAYEAAMESARVIVNETERLVAEDDARHAYREAEQVYRMTRRGMVMNRTIESAILLIAGSLAEHGGDEGDAKGVPPSAERLLCQFRTGLGI